MPHAERQLILMAYQPAKGYFMAWVLFIVGWYLHFLHRCVLSVFFAHSSIEFK